MPEIIQWEYRVQTVGSAWKSLKAEQLEQMLNEWGEEGWEVVSAHVIESTNKVQIVAKRPLTDAVRYRRSMPGNW